MEVAVGQVSLLWVVVIVVMVTMMRMRMVIMMRMTVFMGSRLQLYLFSCARSSSPSLPISSKSCYSSPGDTGGGRSIWGRGRGSGATSREEDQVTLGRIIKMDLIMKMPAFKVGIHGRAMLMMLILHHVNDDVVEKRRKREKS